MNLFPGYSWCKVLQWWANEDYLVRTKLPNDEVTRTSESFGKRNYDFRCDADTLSTNACGERFKIQSGTLNCNSQKVRYLLKFTICENAPYIGEAKAKFGARLENYKSPVKGVTTVLSWILGRHSHNEIHNWQFKLIQQCETHKQMKERKTFWQHRLWTFLSLRA